MNEMYRPDAGSGESCLRGIIIEGDTILEKRYLVRVRAYIGQTLAHRGYASTTQVSVNQRRCLQQREALQLFAEPR